MIQSIMGYIKVERFHSSIVLKFRYKMQLYNNKYFFMLTLLGVLCFFCSVTEAAKKKSSSGFKLPKLPKNRGGKGDDNDNDGNSTSNAFAQGKINQALPLVGVALVIFNV